jgi:hypothetical protein
VRSATGRTRTLKTPRATIVRPTLTATQRGARLTVIAQSVPKARLRIELRRGGRIARVLYRRANTGGAAIIHSALAHVTLVRAQVRRGSRGSKIVSARPVRAR